MASKSHVLTDDSSKFAKFMASLSGGIGVDVGILDKGPMKHPRKPSKNASALTRKRYQQKVKRMQGTTIAYIAQIHEFGLGVVQRSFIRDWATAEQAEICALLAARLAWCMQNNRPMKLGAEQTAVKAAAACQLRMVKGWKYPDILPETKRRKGSSKPLIDLGLLKSAIVGEGFVNSGNQSRR
jgi:hypothetical protein